MTLRITPTAPTLQTKRLTLRPIRDDDAEFLRELGRDPSFILQCSDHFNKPDGVRPFLQWALAALGSRGFGAFVVEERASTLPIGICTLEWHPELAIEHLGFSMLEQYRRNGYTFEAATALLDAFWQRGARRVAAFAKPGNTASRQLIGKLGLRFERIGTLNDTVYAIYRLDRPSCATSDSPWL